MPGHARLSLAANPDSAATEPSIVEWRLARITGLLEPGWRPDQWDPAAQTITYDPDDPLVALSWCRVTGCDVATSMASRLCLGCSIRWKQASKPDIDLWAQDQRPSPSRRQRYGRLCQVSAGGASCPRPACNRHDLCLVHEAERHRQQAVGATFEEFLATAMPKLPLGECAADVCDEPVHLKRLCGRHYHHWRSAGEPAAAAFADWAARVSPNSDGQTVCLRGLHPLAAAEVLYGLQVREREQSKTTPSGVTAYVNLLRDRRVSSILDIDATVVAALGRQGWRGAPVIRDRVQLAYAEPETEREKDAWDARVFGHRRATVWCFSGIGQLWLRQVTKDWAFVAQTRIATVTLQSRVRCMTQLSVQLARRPGGGHDKSAVGRAEIEAFAVALNRAVARGTITNETRRSTLKDVRCVLDEARAVGLLEGVADSFSLTKDLIPPYVAAEEEPGQALPDCVVEQLSSPTARRSAPRGPEAAGGDGGTCRRPGGGGIRDAARHGSAPGRGHLAAG